MAAQGFCRLGLGSMFAFIGSCSILPRAETIEIYQLPSYSTANANAGHADKLAWVLRVSTPRGSRVADTQRVLMLSLDNRISAYKGARWSDPTSALVRNRLTDAFRADGRVSTVNHDNASLLADLELDGDLSAFQVEYIEGAPSAVIRFYGALVQPAQNRIIATRSFEVMQPVEGKGMAEVIKAFGKGADKLAGDIVDWTVEQSYIVRPETR